MDAVSCVIGGSMEYFVMTVTLSTRAIKYLVVYEDKDNGALMVYTKFDDELEALAMAEYLNRG